MAIARGLSIFSRELNGNLIQSKSQKMLKNTVNQCLRILFFNICAIIVQSKNQPIIKTILFKKRLFFWTYFVLFVHFLN